VSAGIVNQLTKIDVEGPYALPWLSDEVLRTEAKLSAGALAEVRDGQLRWILDVPAVEHMDIDTE
jgi:hypothetical protein